MITAEDILNMNFYKKEKFTMTYWYMSVLNRLACENNFLFIIRE